MGQASALYHLQSLDLEIESKRARLDEVDATLGSNRPVRMAQAELDRAKAELTPWEMRVTDLELETKSLVTKSQQTEKRLYSGSVTNPKELQDMQDEIASLKRRHARLEDQLLEAMISVEEHRAEHDSALKKLDRVKAHWAANQVELAQEKEALEAQLDTLSADRTGVWAALDAESRSLYEQLRPVMGGRPLAVLNDGTCSMCGMGQTTSIVQQVRRGAGLVRCPGCGRILVVK